MGGGEKEVGAVGAMVRVNSEGELVTVSSV